MLLFSDKFLGNSITKFIESLSSPNEGVIRSLKKSQAFKQSFIKLEQWLMSESIEYTDLTFDYATSTPPIYEIEKRLEVIKSRINSKTKALSAEYIEKNESVDFESILKTYFDGKDSNLRKIEVTDVNEKISYILNEFSNSVSSTLQTWKGLLKKKQVLKSNKEKTAELWRKMKRIISTYQKQLIRDIEIPFYIYSGKILQTHQSGIGNGIFIKDKTGEDQLKNIRFVSDWDSDHDVLNTMSSGQIAAIVITLYLALNKVYAKGLQVIFIDDPVQTMDEINMISLVELLRNEFSDRQIVISTHEDHVSRYFLYKFLKYGLSAKRFSLIDRKEYQLSNK